MGSNSGHIYISKLFFWYIKSATRHISFIFHFVSQFIVSFRRLGFIHAEQQRKCVKYDVWWKDNLCFLKTPCAEGHCVVTMQSATSGSLKGIDREIHFILLPIVTQLIKPNHEIDLGAQWPLDKLMFIGWGKSITYTNGMSNKVKLYTDQ